MGIGITYVYGTIWWNTVLFFPLFVNCTLLPSFLYWSSVKWLKVTGIHNWGLCGKQHTVPCLVHLSTCKRSCWAAVHLMKLRYFKAISRIHSKLSNLEVDIYQLGRCVALILPVCMCQCKGIFGYPVIYKYHLVILYPQLVSTTHTQDFMGHLLFSSELFEGKLPFLLHLVFKKRLICGFILAGSVLHSGHPCLFWTVRGAYGIQHN